MGALRRAVLVFAAAFAMLFFAAQNSSAATISLAMSMTINANPDSFTVTVHLENQGDAVAHDVAAHLSIMEKGLSTKTIPKLFPKKPVNMTYFEKMDEMPKGSFPALLLVDYHDETGYAFSALHCAAFNTRPDIVTNLSAKADSAEISKEATLGLKLLNPGDRARDFRVRLILPREFNAEDRDRVFLLDSKEQKKLEFKVKNRTALSGGAYPVCFVVEYDEDYVHHTVVADARLTVIDGVSWFRRTRAFWWVFFGLCVLGVLLATFSRKKGEPA